MTTLSLITRNYLSLPQYTRGYIDFLGDEEEINLGPPKPFLQVYVVEQTVVKIHGGNINVRDDD